MLKEFKEFAMRGNIIDLAVGVIIGGAFQKIVSSLVDDIITPLLSIFTGNVDFSQLAYSDIRYGAFLTSILDFIIVAFSIFIVIRYINKLNEKLAKIKEAELEKLAKEGKLRRRKDDNVAEVPTSKVCPFCFSEVNIHATRCPHCTSELEKGE